MRHRTGHAFRAVLSVCLGGQQMLHIVKKQIYKLKVNAFCFAKFRKKSCILAETVL